MRPNKRIAKMWRAVAEGKPELLDDLALQQRKPRAKPVAKEAPLQRATVNFLRKHLPPGCVWRDGKAVLVRDVGRSLCG